MPDARPPAGPAADRFRLAFLRNPTPMWVYDRATLRFLAVNRAAVALYGWSRREFRSMTLRDIRPPEALPALEAALPRGEGRSAPTVHEHRTRDGRRFLVEVVGTSLGWAGRRARLVLATDVTARERTAAALRASEARLAGVIASAMDAIVSVDDAQRIVVFNAAAERIFGVRAADAIGSPLDRFIPARYRAAHGADVRRFGATGGTARSMASPGVLTALRASGEEFPIEATISATAADGGRLYTVILRDVTERERLQAELLQAQKMEAMGQLAAGVAHDFNNLLTVIQGYGEFLATELAAGAHPAVADVHEIQRAAERAATLTRQLLAFSRRHVTRPCAFLPAALVRDAGRMLQRLVGEAVTLDVVVDAAAEARRVVADPAQVEQALMNLVVNARDALPRGGRVTLGVRLAPPELVLEVCDGGVGMSDAVRARACEPFFTTKEAGRGTGLGLSTVQSVARQAGGRFTLESAPGAGTVARLHLPLAADDAGAADAAPGRAAPAAGNAPRGDETVLVVEDDAALRRATSRALRRQGYTVLAAASGEAGVALARTHAGPIALLLTDVVLPGLNGRETADAVAALRPAIAVLYMSGYAADDELRHRVRDGAPFLEKPFGPDALARAVRAVLDA